MYDNVLSRYKVIYQDTDSALIDVEDCSRITRSGKTIKIDNDYLTDGRKLIGSEFG